MLTMSASKLENSTTWKQMYTVDVATLNWKVTSPCICHKQISSHRPRINYTEKIQRSFLQNLKSSPNINDETRLEREHFQLCFLKFGLINFKSKDKTDKLAIIHAWWSIFEKITSSCTLTRNINFLKRMETIYLLYSYLLPDME